MNKLCSVAAILLLAFAAEAQTSQKEQAVLDLSRTKFAWLINKQYDSLNVVLDDKIQFIHSNGWVQGKQEIINDMKSGRLNYQKITVKESAVRLYDKTAIVTGLGTFEGVGNGNTFAMDLRYTEVYTLTGNRWKLASRHANRMP